MKNKTEVIAEAGKQELFIIREFEASPEMVYRAFTEAELLVQWMAPCDFTTTIDRLENKEGGSWRFLYTDPKGNSFGFRGVFHELVPGVRMIRTFEFEGLPEKGHVVMETVRFQKLGNGRTKTVIQSVFQSVADRDGRVQAGVEQGVNDSYGRLDELLSKH
jgi:uncharacterized protein YndB with AHSA1/START domain